MSDGLVKFRDVQKTGDRSLYWSRASIDGAPLRARAAPTYTEQEFEEKVVRVKDFQFRKFRMRNREDRKAYREVMDRIANGWYQLVHIRRNWRKEVFYVEWVEFYMEDGTRAPQPQGMMSYGQSNR